MVAWTDLPQYKNPACKFAGSCRKFYPATPLLRPWVSTISTDVFGIQHFDSDSSAQPSTGKAAFADLANARKGRQMGKIQFTNNFLTHRVPFMLSPGRSLHLGQKSASNPPVAAPKKIRHATGPLFLPGPQNRRPTNSVSFSPRNPKEFTISKIEVENGSKMAHRLFRTHCSRTQGTPQPSNRGG
ncbi:hypothetical protein R3P38DRAFT_2771978 [Favolaschia claudopus]|uniref:Uncharacterized protein n=1 Tax=Favolaschia claudopus TaxID=2862362 RepID=A0AAW0C8T2_9AGAR